MSGRRVLLGGLLYQKWREAYGRNDPDVLVVKGTALSSERQNATSSRCACALC
jgi:hypothetical protein